MQRAQQTLGNQGINLHLALPQTRLEQGYLNFDGLLNAGTAHYQTRHEVDSIGGSIGRFFGDFFGTYWGYRYEDHYIVDLDKIERQIDVAIQNLEAANHRQSEAYIKSQVQPVLESTFAQLHQYLAGFQQVLADGIADNQQQEIQRETLKHTLEQLLHDSDSRLQRIRSTKQQLPR